MGRSPQDPLGEHSRRWSDGDGDVTCRGDDGCASCDDTTHDNIHDSFHDDIPDSSHDTAHDTAYDGDDDLHHGRERQPRLRWGVARSAALVFLGVALAVGAALFLVRSSEPSAAAVSVELDAERGGGAASGDASGDPAGGPSEDFSEAGAPESPLIPEPGGGSGGAPDAGPSPASPGSLGADRGAGDLIQTVVYVTGAVASPGVVSVPPGTRLFGVLERVGGPLPEADLEGINLAGVPADGQHIHVLAVGEEPRAGSGSVAAQTEEPQGGVAGDVASGTTGGTPGGTIDINTATLAEIEALPRVGPVLGQRIIEWRETQGPFARAADIDAVPGIGPALLEGILPLISAE